MNKLYIGIILLGFLNIAILVANITIIQKFKDFETLSNTFFRIVGRYDKQHDLILKQYKDMAERYDSQEALFGTMCKQYEEITDRYKKICEITDGYRKLCKECVDRYGDAYDQFKLCTEKLDRILIAPACSCGSGESVDDEPIGGFHDA